MKQKTSQEVRQEIIDIRDYSEGNNVVISNELLQVLEGLEIDLAATDSTGVEDGDNLLHPEHREKPYGMPLKKEYAALRQSSNREKISKKQEGIMTEIEERKNNLTYMLKQDHVQFLAIISDNFATYNYHERKHICQKLCSKLTKNNVVKNPEFFDNFAIFLTNHLEDFDYVMRAKFLAKLAHVIPNNRYSFIDELVSHYQENQAQQTDPSNPKYYILEAEVAAVKAAHLADRKQSYIEAIQQQGADSYWTQGQEDEGALSAALAAEDENFFDLLYPDLMTSPLYDEAKKLTKKHANSKTQNANIYFFARLLESGMSYDEIKAKKELLDSFGYSLQPNSEARSGTGRARLYYMPMDELQDVVAVYKDIIKTIHEHAKGEAIEEQDIDTPHISANFFLGGAEGLRSWAKTNKNWLKNERLRNQRDYSLLNRVGYDPIHKQSFEARRLIERKRSTIHHFTSRIRVSPTSFFEELNKHWHKAKPFIEPQLASLVNTHVVETNPYLKPREIFHPFYTFVNNNLSNLDPLTREYLLKKLLHMGRNGKRRYKDPKIALLQKLEADYKELPDSKDDTLSQFQDIIELRQDRLYTTQKEFVEAEKLIHLEALKAYDKERDRTFYELMEPIIMAKENNLFELLFDDLYHDTSPMHYVKALIIIVQQGATYEQVVANMQLLDRIGCSLKGSYAEQTLFSSLEKYNALYVPTTTLKDNIERLEARTNSRYIDRERLSVDFLTAPTHLLKEHVNRKKKRSRSYLQDTWHPLRLAIDTEKKIAGLDYI